jgi:hypothetical protein
MEKFCSEQGKKDITESGQNKIFLETLEKVLTKIGREYNKKDFLKTPKKGLDNAKAGC